MNDRSFVKSEGTTIVLLPVLRLGQA